MSHFSKEWLQTSWGDSQEHKSNLLNESASFKEFKCIKIEVEFWKIEFLAYFCSNIDFLLSQGATICLKKPCILASEYMSLLKKRLGGSVQSFFLLWIFNSSKISKKQPLSLVFSPKVNFSHTQLPSIALKCYPSITSLPQHTKDGEKNWIYMR